jgi:membrane-associated protease RseP (regulator of RpoE activity)
LGIILALLIFSFIVLFHEFGHFILAKKNGIDVEEFALGMGPVLFSKEYKGTRYALHLFPIGGFCAMGEDDEATDSPGNFNNKSVWARISVIAAGPIFNFILAFALSVILVSMTGYDRPVVSSVEKGFPAEEAGLKAGDTIVRMGGKRIHLFREITFYNQFHQGEQTEITYLRDGQKYTTVLVPVMDEELGYYRFGISGGAYTKADILTAMQYGAYQVKYWINITIDSLKMLLTGQVGIDQMSGPVGIVDMVDDSYKESRSYGAYAVIMQLLYIAILLSANIGVMNLLPLPALDGGRLVFLLIEAVRRKRVPPEKEGYVHMVGIALLMVLMVFIMYNDIRRVFFN